MWPAIIAGTAALGSAAAGYFGQRKQAKEAKQLSDREYQRNYQAFLENREYSNPANQMKRFKDAGLNPNLVYGQGTPGNVENIPQYQAPSPQFATVNPAESIAQGLESYTNIRKTAKQADLIQQQTDLTAQKAETEAMQTLLTENAKDLTYYKAHLKSLVSSQARGTLGTDYGKAQIMQAISEAKSSELQVTYDRLKNEYQEKVNYWANKGMSIGDQIQWRALVQIVQGISGQLGIDPSWLKIQEIE